MKTDREMLELAARAAGYESKWEQPRGAKAGRLRIKVADRWVIWAPDVDDGDSFRLAVQVKKFPRLLHDGSGVSNGYYHARSKSIPIIELFEGDANAAVRAAILRAAAESGRQMAESSPDKLPKEFA